MIEAMKTTREILIEAAELIERNGKAEGAFVWEVPGIPWANSPMCAVGAIREATGWHAKCPAGKCLAEDSYQSSYAEWLTVRNRAYRVLVDHLLTNALAYEPSRNRRESIGIIVDWSDNHDAATVVSELRAAAGELT